MFIPPFTSNWRSFTAALTWRGAGDAGAAAAYAGVLITLTHASLFGRELELPAALRDGIRALPRLGWLLAATLLGSPLLAMTAVVILLPIYGIDLLLGRSGVTALASTLGRQLASLAHLVGFELSPSHARYWAPRSLSGAARRSWSIPGCGSRCAG